MHSRRLDILGFPGGSAVKNLPVVRRCRFFPWVRKTPLEKETATHSSILARRIPWTEEPAGYRLWGHKELDTT